jgi:CheY-like chemotaxis protein
MPFNVLIVDDDPPVLQTLKSVFETRDFQVSTANSGAEAAQKLSEVPFDLVVTDMRMETPTSGFEVVRTGKDKDSPPAVVILSAYPIPVTEWRAAGADGMFMKGGGIARMLDDLEHLVRTHRPRAPQAEGREVSREQAG